MAKTGRSRKSKKQFVTLSEVQEKLKRLDEQIRSWETKHKTAFNALLKLRKQQRYYNEKLSSLATLQAKQIDKTGSDRHITVEDDE